MIKFSVINSEQPSYLTKRYRIENGNVIKTSGGQMTAEPKLFHQPILINDHFQNFKSYNIPRGHNLSLLIFHTTLAKNAYGSNPYGIVGQGATLGMGTARISRQRKFPL